MAENNTPLNQNKTSWYNNPNHHTHYTHAHLPGKLTRISTNQGSTEKGNTPHTLTLGNVPSQNLTHGYITANVKTPRLGARYWCLHPLEGGSLSTDGGLAPPPRSD